MFYEVAIGPVTGRTSYSYRSGSHVLSIFWLWFYSLGLVRVRNRVWVSIRLYRNSGWVSVRVRNSVWVQAALGLGFGLESSFFAFLLY